MSEPRPPHRERGRLPSTRIAVPCLAAAGTEAAHAQAQQSGSNPPAGPDIVPALASAPPIDPAFPLGGAPHAGQALPHELSPWGMFLHADNVVKAVMLGLAFASLVTWTLWIARGSALAKATWRARAAVRALGTAGGLDADAPVLASRRSGPVVAMVDAARDEVERSAGLPAEGIKERVGLALGRIEARAARSMSRGTGVIATIGSTAPFVGLFGTVWGIMDSFVGISQAHTSNLAVVAPGIAEALLATAIGLVAAIPAVVIYNGFARATAAYRGLLGDASAEVMRHLSRDLDRASTAAHSTHRAAE